jgi:site-specific recombinase XerD
VNQLGDQQVKAVSTEQLRAHVAELRDSGSLKPATVHGHVRAIKRIFNWFAAEGVIDEKNPAERIRQQPLPDTPPKAISVSDALKLLMATDEVGKPWEQARNRAIVMFLFDTGCRVGGLVKLSLAKLDLAERIAIVEEKKGKWRFVFLLPPTVEAMETWLQVRSERHNVSQTEEAVFASRNGSPLTRSGVARMLQRLSRVAGVEGPTNAHAFRHGFAISYLMNDGDLATLCDLLASPLNGRRLTA